jgi:beta-N-acetylhexosaminidase
MTVEEKVGQMFMFGFYGATPNADAEKIIQEYHAGGVVLFNFSNNVIDPQQTARLNNGLQTMAKIPLLTAVDQEGGIVARVNKDATVFPGNMALGATRNLHMAQEAGRITGEEIRAVGFNMDLAPDMDVNTNPANPVIGIRSFGEDPQLVADMGTSFIKGLQKNVLATAKHFPGHGDTNVDSHYGLPIINKSAAEFEKVELVPFKRAVADGVDAIMTAHIVVPALDPSGVPATLSKPILTGILREKLGYNGLIITDSMAMAAVRNGFGGLAQASVKALDAGADIVLFDPSLTVAQQGEAYAEAVKAVKAGTLSEERVNQSVARILASKEKHGLLDPKKVQANLKQIEHQVGTKANLQKAQDIADKAITLVKNDNNILPLKLEDNKKIAVVSQYSLLDRIKPYHANTTELQITPVNPSDALIQQSVEFAKDADVIIAGTYNAHKNPQQAKQIKALQALGKPVIVAAFRDPYDLRVFPDVKGYLAAYGYRPELLQATVDVMFGAKSPSGKLPVTIPGAADYGTGLTFKAKAK